MRGFLGIAAASLCISSAVATEIYVVTPFQNASGNANLTWIGESLAETVREALVRNGVAVLTRETREEAAHRLALPPATPLSHASLIKLAREMGADRVIHGQFEWTPEEGAGAPAKGRIMIRSRTIDATAVTRGPEIVEEGEMASLAEFETRIAWRVLESAVAEKAPSWDEHLEKSPPVRIDAVEAYTRGLMAPDLEQRHRYFAQAARLAPGYSAPRYQLGRMQWEERSYRAAAQWLESVPEADAHYLEANFLLGLCRYHVGDHAGALESFRAAALLTPLPWVYNNLGLAQLRFDGEQALDSLLWAAEADPSEPDYQFNVGYALWRMGDLDGAAEHFRAVLDIVPEDADARKLLERCLSADGPRRGDLSSEGLERLQEDLRLYEDRRWLGAAWPPAARR